MQTHGQIVIVTNQFGHPSVLNIAIMRLLKLLSLSAITLCLSHGAVYAMPQFNSSSGVEVNFDMLDQIKAMPKDARQLPESFRPYKTPTAATQTPPLEQPKIAEAQTYAAPKTIAIDTNYNQETPETNTRQAKADIPNYGFVPLAEKWIDPQKTKREKITLEKETDLRVIKGAPPPFNTWDALWTNRIHVGGSLQKGDGESSRFDLKGASYAEWENKDRLNFLLEIGFEEDKENETADDRYFLSTFDDFITDDIFLRYDTSLESDDVSGIDFRATAGLSVGYQVIDHPQVKLNFSLGSDFLLEELHNDRDGENDKDLACNWRLDFERKMYDDFITLYHHQRLLVPAERNNDYVFKSNTGARFPLHENFIATLDIDHEIDEGVEIGKSETDTKYSFLLGYEW